MNDRDYLESQITALEKLIKVKTQKGYKSEDLSEEIHDLALFKRQLGE